MEFLVVAVLLYAFWIFMKKINKANKAEGYSRVFYIHDLLIIYISCILTLYIIDALQGRFDLGVVNNIITATIISFVIILMSAMNSCKNRKLIYANNLLINLFLIASTLIVLIINTNIPSILKIIVAFGVYSPFMYALEKISKYSKL